MIFRRKVKTEKLQSFLTLVTITQLLFFSKFRRVCVCVSVLMVCLIFSAMGKGVFGSSTCFKKGEQRPETLFRISYTQKL
jgi:hypothetical protein